MLFFLSFLSKKGQPPGRTVRRDSVALGGQRRPRSHGGTSPLVRRGRTLERREAVSQPTRRPASVGCLVSQLPLANAPGAKNQTKLVVQSVPVRSQGGAGEVKWGNVLVVLEVLCRTRFAFVVQRYRNAYL